MPPSLPNPANLPNTPTVPPPVAPGLRLRILLLLFAANSLSGFAQGITLIGIPWYWVAQSGPDGKFLLAQTLFVTSALTLVWSLYAGTLVDRYDRRHIFLVLNAVGVLLLGTAAAVAWRAESAGQVVPYLMLAAVMTGTFLSYNVHYPNLYAFVQQLFPPGKYARVNSAIEIQGQLTNFLGMTTGAFLTAGFATDAEGLAWLPQLQLEPWPLWQIFSLNAGTYALALLLVWGIRTVGLPRAADAPLPVWQRFRFGYQYLRQRPIIFRVGAASSLLFVTVLVTFQAILPTYIHDVLQAPGGLLGLSEGTFALGALGAGVAVALAGGRIARLHKVTLLALTTLIGGLLQLWLTLTPTAMTLLAAAAGIGLMNSFSRIYRITYLFEVVGNEVMGRVSSFFVVFVTLVRQGFLGLLLLPFFSADANGPNILYLTGAQAVLLLLAAWVLFGSLGAVSRFAQVNGMQDRG
jgi:MFS family permease